MAKFLTDLGIESKAAPKRRTFTADARCPGLFLVVQPTGKKSWIVARRLEGKFIKLKIGSFPAFKVEQARQEAAKYLQAFERGENPKEVKQAEQTARQSTQAETIAVVGESWLKRDQADKRGFKAVERFFKNRLVPAWGDRPISSITKKDCLAFIDKYADESSAVRSNRIFTYIHRMFSWCVERDILTFNPLAGAKKLATENSRERVLEDKELVEVWNASDNLDGDPRRPDEPLKTNQYKQDGPIWGPIIKLLILTGARREEIGGLRWSEINLREGVLKLPGNRTKRLPKDKNKGRLIYLSQKAKEIIQSLPHRENCDFVFTVTGTGPVCGWEKAKTRLEKLITQARSEAKITQEMDGWWIHDLRRTLATGFQKLGIRLEVTENVLGHLSGSRSGVVKVYQRYNFEKESREAVELWADHIEDLLNGRLEEKVLTLPKAHAS